MRRLIESEVIDGSELRVIVEASTGTPQLVPGTDTTLRPMRPASPTDAESPAVDDGSGATADAPAAV